MYSVDYNIVVSDLMVPNKRWPKRLAWVRALVACISQAHTSLFETYRNANFTATAWNGSPVARNAIVRYGKSIFRSEVDANTSEPTFSDTWTLITDNYLGTDFRLAIRGEKLILEYALNIWFETTFLQPPLQSDIYITTNAVLSTPVFRVGATEADSSNVTLVGSSEFVVNDYSFSAQANMSINIPQAVYDALGASDDVREAIVRSFADKYVNAGIIYTINPY